MTAKKKKNVQVVKTLKNSKRGMQVLKKMGTDNIAL